MKKPESPCLDCADRSVGCHAPGACPAPYPYEQYCADLERYRQFVRQNKADQHLSITDGMRFTRPKKKWVYKRGKD